MPAMSKAEVLKQSLIFSGLSHDELKVLADLAVERRFPAGEFILWEGDAPEFFYVVAEGRVKIVKHSSTGKDFIIAFFNPGEMFGEVAVFQNKPYPASAQAATDVSVLCINRGEFLSFLAGHPEVSLAIITVLGGRLRDAQNRLKDLAAERVERRLCRLLLMLSEKLGNTLPFTRQEIADMAGTTTETAIRFTTQLKERKIIHTVRGKITILNAEKLRLLSEGPPRP